VKPIQIVDIKKLIFYPITIFIILIMGVGFLMFSLMINTYKSELLVNGSSLTNAFSEQISLSYQMRDNIITDVDETNLATARLIVNHRDLLSNDYLLEQMEIMGVSDIWWYNSSGEVIYDARDQYIGWTPTINDPIYNFMNSDLDVYIEDIRTSTENDNQLKNVYLRDTDGSFVQVSTTLEAIEERLELFENQSLIDKLNESYPELYYIQIIDSNYTNIADTDIESVGTIYSQSEHYAKSFNGITNGAYIIYEKQQEDVLEISAPITYNNQVIAIITIGLSLQGLAPYQSFLVSNILLLTITIAGLFSLLQLYWIRRPLKHLSKSISNLNYKTGIIQPKSNIFQGLYATINQFIETINENNEINERNIETNIYISNHDYLTNLINRRGFINEMSTWIERNNHFVIFFIDIDNFKHYNDLKGHSFGDQLLIEFATLIGNFDFKDCIAARYGGDEFIIGYHTIDEEEIKKIGKKLLKTLNSDIQIDLFQCYLSVSIGVSFYPRDGKNLEEVIENAEKANIEAKKQQGTNILYFDEKYKDEAKYNTEITEMLMHCLKNDSFELVYQPQVNIKDKQIVALEALLRIKGSNLSPGIFVPIAEKNGLMIKIGRIVITKVIKQMVAWKKKGIKLIPVYINFSSTQLHDQSISSFIEKKMVENDISPNLIGIEITEDVFVEKEGLVLSTLKSLKLMGIHTAIDDFGSGQAGVNYLTNFEVDLVKIDKSVADKYLIDKTAAIYTTIVKLCTTLGFEVLAEGIETEEQIQLLKKMNVPTVQGYYYYKPLKVKDIELMLDK